MLTPQQIQNEINNKITHIHVVDFHVTHEEEDGCDEYGPKYWVTCHNGWFGRDHELFPAITKAQQEFYSQIMVEGFLASDQQKYQIPSHQGLTRPEITESKLFETPSPQIKIISEIKRKITEFEVETEYQLAYLNFMEYHFPRTLSTSWEDFQTSLHQIFQWKFPYRYGAPQILDIIEDILTQIPLTREEKRVIDS